MCVCAQKLFILLKAPFKIASEIFLEDIDAPAPLVADPAISAESENLNNGAEVYHPQDNEEEGSVIDEEVAQPSTDLSQNDMVTVHDSTSSVQDDAPKKSYASIVSFPCFAVFFLSLKFIN